MAQKNCTEHSCLCCFVVVRTSKQAYCLPQTRPLRKLPLTKCGLLLKLATPKVLETIGPGCTEQAIKLLNTYLLRNREGQTSFRCRAWTTAPRPSFMKTKEPFRLSSHRRRVKMGLKAQTVAVLKVRSKSVSC